MKTPRLKSLLVSALLALAVTISSAATATAQTNPPSFTQPPAPAPLPAMPPGPDTFFSTLKDYFSSFNPDLHPFDTNNFELRLGSEYLSGVNVTASFGLEYILKDFNGFKLSVDSVTRNAGIAGVIVDQQIDFGISKVIMDLKLTAYVGGGYDFNRTRGYAAIGARLEKALTTHTFAGISLETQIQGKPGVPLVGIFTGFTF